MFGVKDMLPIPDYLVTLDTDTAEVRRQKNLYADGLLSVVGNIIGYAAYLKGGRKPKLDFVEPLDDTAQQYVARETARTSEPAFSWCRNRRSSKTAKVTKSLFRR